MTLGLSFSVRKCYVYKSCQVLVSMVTLGLGVGLLNVLEGSAVCESDGRLFPRTGAGLFACSSQCFASCFALSDTDRRGFVLLLASVAINCAVALVSIVFSRRQSVCGMRLLSVLYAVCFCVSLAWLWLVLPFVFFPTALIRGVAVPLFLALFVSVPLLACNFHLMYEGARALRRASLLPLSDASDASECSAEYVLAPCASPTPSTASTASCSSLSDLSPIMIPRSCSFGVDDESPSPSALYRSISAEPLFTPSMQLLDGSVITIDIRD